MFSHLSSLRISHGDVRWANIVSAPEPPSGSHGRYGPHHDVDHPWRIIDFDLSTKSPKSPEDCHYHYTSMIDLLLLQLSRGFGGTYGPFFNCEHTTPLIWLVRIERYNLFCFMGECTTCCFIEYYIIVAVTQMLSRYSPPTSTPLWGEVGRHVSHRWDSGCQGELNDETIVSPITDR